jgi:hypothetical protein
MTETESPQTTEARPHLLLHHAEEKRFGVMRLSDEVKGNIHPDFFVEITLLKTPATM